MSDVRDRVFGPCQTCLRPICQCPAKPTPPPDAQAMTRDPLTTMDAKLWAEEFMRIFGSKTGKIDEGLMTAWFANAIMKGYDVGRERQAETIRRLEETINKADYRLIMNPPDGGDPSLLEKAQYLVDRLNHANVELASPQARLTASETKHKWTTARPTVKGQYWWRGSTDDKYPEVIPVFLVQGKSELHAQWGSYIALAEGGEWQGPLTPGEE